jgi:molybdopterin/thiamine biosynthesis adenylyltransferase
VDKYARQRALVEQDILADAHVTVHGTGPALPYLLQCLALAGVGTRYGSIRLCVPDRPVSAADLAGQFLLKPDDLGKAFGPALANRVAGLDEAIDIAAAGSEDRGLNVAVPAAAEVAELVAGTQIDAWGQVLRASVYVGPDPLRGLMDTGPNMLTAALAAVCGGLLAQSVLRQLGALNNGPAVLMDWLEQRLWLKYPGIGTHAKAAMLNMASTTDGPVWPALRGVLERACPDDVADRFQIYTDGQTTDSRVTAVINDDEVLVSVRLSKGSAALRMATVRSSLAKPTRVRPLLWSPIDGPILNSGQVSGDDMPLSEHMPPLRLVICGAGALGSWASAVLAASGFPDLDVCLVDIDDTVETHNLNRQVLFGETDVGEPKARRAVMRLSQIDPRARLQALQVMITPQLIGELTGTEITFEFVDEAFQQELDAYRAQVHALADALGQATAVLSCPDSHQTRWALNVIAERLGIPLVNGAMEGFIGRVHVCDPGDHSRCLVCWLGTMIATDAVRQECTGIGQEAPVPSIVTTAAIVGASQAATLIAALAGQGHKVQRFHAFNGVVGGLDGYRGADRNPDECPAHLFSPACEPVAGAASEAQAEEA